MQYPLLQQPGASSCSSYIHCNTSWPAKLWDRRVMRIRSLTPTTRNLPGRTIAPGLMFGNQTAGCSQPLLYVDMPTISEKLEQWKIAGASYCGDPFVFNDMGVSKNRGTPTWMVYIGKPYKNGWFGGPTPIFGNTHMDILNGNSARCHCAWSN